MLGFIMAYTFLDANYLCRFVGVRLRRLGRARGYQTQSAFIGDYYQSPFLRWGVSLFGVVFSIRTSWSAPWQWELSSTSSRIPLLGWSSGLRHRGDDLHYQGRPTRRRQHRRLSRTSPGSVPGCGRRQPGSPRRRLVQYSDSPKAVVPTSGLGLKQFFAWIPYLGLVTFCWPDRAFRMFAVKDDANLRKGCVISGAMMTAASVGFLAIGLAANKIVPGIKNTDTSLASALQVQPCGWCLGL